MCCAFLCISDMGFRSIAERIWASWGDSGCCGTCLCTLEYAFVFGDRSRDCGIRSDGGGERVLRGISLCIAGD